MSPIASPRPSLLRLLPSLLALLAGVDFVHAQPDTPDNTQNAATAPAPDSVADNLLEDILNQPMGRFRVADLGMPPPFLSRVRDRMLIALVQRDLLPNAPSPLPPPSRPQAPPSLSILKHEPNLDLLRALKALQGVRPEARGFKASILPPLPELSPFLPADLDPRWAEVATMVNTSLASQGLLRTAAQALALLGPELTDAAHFPQTTQTLSKVGLPVDLLDHFRLADATGEAILIELAARLGVKDATPESVVREAMFTPRRTHDFQVSDEGGTAPVAMLRIQVPTASLWGSGGGLIDSVTQTLSHLPDCDLLASVNQADVRHVLPLACAWAGNGRRVSVVSEALPVAQWAQDTAKAGRAGGEMASLVPRYASQNEDGSVFAPNESYMAAGWNAAGHRVIHAPLIFQGGNLMAVRDRESLVLLVGEAEVWRNTALGLSEQQTVRLFQLEFGADRVVVLPSASFHLDLDFTIRSRAGAAPVVLLSDWREGSLQLLKAGISTVLAEGQVPEAGVQALRDLQTSDKMPDAAMIRAAVSILGPLLRASVQDKAMSAHERQDRAEWAARLQIALDVLMANGDIQDETNPISAAYLGALRRKLLCRDELERKVQELEWNVARVPGVPGVMTYVNGLHDSESYFMPSLGGRFEALDRLAAARVQQAIGPQIQVVPIPSSQVQMRAGGLHCVVAAYRRDR